MRLNIRSLLMSLVIVSTYSSGVTEQDFVYDSLSRQLSEEMKSNLAVMNDPQIVEAQAKYIRSLYQALIKQGFSKDEALTLVAASLQSKS